MLYQRLRGNSGGWPVLAMPTDASAQFPAIAFNVRPASLPTREVGGDDLIAHFLVTVVAVGAQNVDDLEPLRPMVKEISESLRSSSAIPANVYADGAVLFALRGMDVCQMVRDPQGVGQWMLGHQWEIRVQPDASY